MVEIVTERLRLRPFEPGDLPAFAAYRSASDVARYQSWDDTFSLADAERFLAEQQELAFGAPGAWVQLAAIDRGSGALVGDCAVRVASEQPATATPPSTGSSSAWASGARRGSSKPTGSRASGRCSASTRSCAASGRHDP